MEQHKQCPRCGKWVYGYNTTAGFAPGPHYCNPKKDDPIAAAREWARHREEGYITYAEDAKGHIDALLAKIEQQYTRGYNKAIEDAIAAIEAEKVGNYMSGDVDYNEAVEACRGSVAALRKGGEDNRDNGYRGYAGQPDPWGNDD